MRPPRSLLFVPGSRPERFEKAAASGCDAIIIDLEDAVAPADKDRARTATVDYLRAGTCSCQTIVRINPLGTFLGLQDCLALADAAPDYLMVPKAEVAGDLILLDRILKDRGVASRIIALVESAAGVMEASAIARATPSVAALMFGAADYAADIGLQVGTFQPDYVRNTIVNAAAAAAGVVAIDSPFFDIKDPEGLEEECEQTRMLGFFGKAAIHPGQIPAIARIFGPKPDDLERAERIIAAAPDGVGVLDGKMIDIAMVRWAQRVLGAA
jgi:(S)-citramalyl-CoA lyase